MKSMDRVRASAALVVSLAVASCAWAAAPASDRILTEDTVKVSEHVWVIYGYPNIAYVVGGHTTLVVDTGLGRRNGATAAKVARKLAPRNRIILTTTHFHPEHASGVMGFPADTLLIRNQVQQDELERRGGEMTEFFASQDELTRSLLEGPPLRVPDMIFDRKLQLNLGGGVTAQLLYFGPTHTQGDQLIFVDPDKTLISGDVVQNKVVPNSFREQGGTAASWIAVVDAAAQLGARHVVPTHSPIGDGSLVAKEKAFLVEFRDRALALKRQGMSVEEAGQLVTNEAKERYPDWTMRGNGLTAFVKAAYAE